MRTPARKKKSAKVSAGLLMFRTRAGCTEVLLVHPGGPYWAKRDEGSWSLPKGELEGDEDPLVRARVEFEEELGFPPQGTWIPLGSVTQAGGKMVHAWAFQGSLPANFALRSNTFELEWPPRSGKLKSFPEIDRAEFFDEATARRKLNPAQAEFLDRLQQELARRHGAQGVE